MKTVRTFIACLIIAAGGAAGPASACSVPVFRYALNYWPADTYELRGHAIRLPDVTINLDQKEDTQGARLLFGDRKVWSGVADPATIAAMLDSPVRRELVSRILHGDSVVWLLVESGDAAKDTAAADALTKRLNYLESIAITPELRPGDPFNRLGPGPTLAIRHSVLRVSRKDPRETFTLATLERDAADPSTPMAYPVFGRGRVLIGLPQAKLTNDNIDEIALFLTSACSCEVKDRRQGWDLLLQVDWDEELAKVEQKRRDGNEDPRPAEPTTRSATAAPAIVPQSELKPETVTIQAKADTPAAQPSPVTLPSKQVMVLGLAAAVVVVGFAGGLWIRKRR